MEYKSEFIDILKANGASKDSCKEAGIKLRGIELVFEKEIVDFCKDALFLSLFFKKEEKRMVPSERIVPSKLFKKVNSPPWRNFIVLSSKGEEYKGAVTNKGNRKFCEMLDIMKKTDLDTFNRFNDYMIYLNRKMY